MSGAEGVDRRFHSRDGGPFPASFASVRPRARLAALPPEMERQDGRRNARHASPRASPGRDRNDPAQAGRPPRGSRVALSPGLRRRHRVHVARRRSRDDGHVLSVSRPPRARRLRGSQSPAGAGGPFSRGREKRASSSRSRCRSPSAASSEESSSPSRARSESSARRSSSRATFPAKRRPSRWRSTATCSSAATRTPRGSSASRP